MVGEMQKGQPSSDSSVANKGVDGNQTDWVTLFVDGHEQTANPNAATPQAWCDPKANLRLLWSPCRPQDDNATYLGSSLHQLAAVLTRLHIRVDSTWPPSPPSSDGKIGETNDNEPALDGNEPVPTTTFDLADTKFPKLQSLVLSFPTGDVTDRERDVLQHIIDSAHNLTHLVMRNIPNVAMFTWPASITSVEVTAYGYQLSTKWHPHGPLTNTFPLLESLSVEWPTDAGNHQALLRFVEHHQGNLRFLHCASPRDRKEVDLSGVLPSLPALTELILDTGHSDTGNSGVLLLPPAEGLPRLTSLVLRGNGLTAKLFHDVWIQPLVIPKTLRDLAVVTAPHHGCLTREQMCHIGQLCPNLQTLAIPVNVACPDAALVDFKNVQVVRLAYQTTGSLDDYTNLASWCKRLRRQMPLLHTMFLAVTAGPELLTETNTKVGQELLAEIAASGVAIAGQELAVAIATSGVVTWGFPEGCSFLHNTRETLRRLCQTSPQEAPGTQPPGPQTLMRDNILEMVDNGNMEAWYKLVSPKPPAIISHPPVSQGTTLIYRRHVDVYLTQEKPRFPAYAWSDSKTLPFVVTHETIRSGYLPGPGGKSWQYRVQDPRDKTQTLKRVLEISAGGSGLAYSNFHQYEVSCPLDAQVPEPQILKANQYVTFTRAITVNDRVYRVNLVHLVPGTRYAVNVYVMVEVECITDATKVTEFQKIGIDTDLKYIAASICIMDEIGVANLSTYEDTIAFFTYFVTHVSSIVKGATLTKELAGAPFPVPKLNKPWVTNLYDANVMRNLVDEVRNGGPKP